MIKRGVCDAFASTIARWLAEGRTRSSYCLGDHPPASSIRRGATSRSSYRSGKPCRGSRIELVRRVRTSRILGVEFADGAGLGEA